MKISFPYMGCVTGYQKAFELLGHEIIMPRRPTQRTIDLGVKYSPEFFCFPFKVMTGTYIEAAEDGAELIATSGGNGPCRAGYYGEVHKRILSELGYKTEVKIFDSIFNDFSGFMQTLKSLKNGTPLYKVPSVLSLGIGIIFSLDALEKKMKVLRAYEVHHGDFAKVWEKVVQLHADCYTAKDLKRAKKESEELFSSVELNPVPEDKKIRIGVVGEIYVTMESASNMDIEERLNHLGVEMYNTQYLSDWLKHSVIHESLPFNPIAKVRKKALKYTNINCGGHDMSNIGHMVDFAERGFDGIVHLMPFSCLPELVTRSVIPSFSEEYDIPVLSISLDEQMGSANNQTRLEAFVDLVRNKKENRQPTIKGVGCENKTHKMSVEFAEVK